MQADEDGARSSAGGPAGNAGGHVEDVGGQIGTVAAIALPLLFFIAALPGFAYWGEPARLLDAAVTLEHGGSPVATLIAGLVVRLPLGPLSLRVALSMALCAAVAGGALFAALRLALQRIGVERDSLRVAAAFGSTCVAMGQEPMWSMVLQGNPQLVGIALGMLLLHRLLRSELLPPNPLRDTRALAAGGLYLGLLTSHDPAFGLALCGAWLWSMRGLSRWPRGAALGAALGLLPMALSAMRGQDGAALGAAGGQLSALPQLIDGYAAQAVPMRVLAPIAALACAAMLLRRQTRDDGVLWLLGLLLPAALGLLLRPTASTVQAAFAMVSLCAVVFATLGVGLLVAGAARTERLGTGLAVAWLVLGIVQLRDASITRSLAGFDTSAVLQRQAADHLPPRAVLLWPRAHGHADAVGYRTEHGARPDLLAIPLSRARDPQVSEALAEEAPILRDLLRDLMLRGELGVPALQSLASEVPVAVDLPATALPTLGETVLPSGAWMEVVADGTARRDRREAARAQAAYYAGIYGDMDPQRLDAASRGVLLRLHRRDALYYMHAGDRDAARGALGLAETLAPGDAGLDAMAAALGPADDADRADDGGKPPAKPATKPATGPIDIAPLLSAGD